VATATVGGRDRGLVRSVRFGYRGARKDDRGAPFAARFRVGSGRLGARITAAVVLRDGRRTSLRRAVRPCARALPGFTG
jgi:hypothetical protein